MNVRTAGLAVILVCATAALVFALRGPASSLDPGDFRAFYCAGRVANLGADPYRTEPLRTCERETTPAAYRQLPGFVVPAPIPSYDTGIMRVFALLDFASATALFEILVLAATVATVAHLHRLGAVPMWQLLAIFAVSDLYVSVLVGQIAVFAIAFAVLAASALARARPARAAIYATATLIEPHLGLPVVLALAIFAPLARRTLIAALVVTGIVSAIAMPLSQSLEYLTTVLPAHVATELVSHEQLSLTNLLWIAGVPGALAIRLGSLSYIATTAFGLFAVRALRTNAADPLIVLLPLGIAPIGGPFVHSTQVAASLPLLVLAVRRGIAPRFGAALALALLAFPWNQLVGNSVPVAVTLFAVLVAFVSARGIAALALPASLALAAGAGALVLTLHAIGLPHRIDAGFAPALATLSPSGYADEAWLLFNEHSWIYDVPNYIAARAPTWIGELMTLAIVAAAMRGRRFIAR